MTNKIYSIDEIRSIVTPIAVKYGLSRVFLFGSYAKGSATESSDVDLLIATNLSGLKYYGMVEALREKLHKKVDALDFGQLKNNPELLNDILKDGIRIYAKG